MTKQSSGPAIQAFCQGPSVARSPTRERRLSAWLLLLLACVAAPRVARAEATGYKLALLELESDAVHDEFAGLLTERLRSVLSSRSGYQLLETRVSLAQLTLAQDCSSGEAACLAKIAHELKADGFVFGKVTHEGGAPVGLLRRYDVRAESVDHTAVVSFTSQTVGSDELESGAEKLIADLLGKAPSAAAPAAAPKLEPVPPAPKPLEVPAVATGSGVTLREAAAYGLLAGSILSAGLAVASFIKVDGAEHNADFSRYRYSVGDTRPDVRDVCAEAAHNQAYGLDAASFRNVKSSCSAGKTFEVLQFVFIGAAVVTGGLSAYLLVNGNDEQPAPESKLSFQPNLGRRSFGMDAQLTF